jgi:hypothetical protein
MASTSVRALAGLALVASAVACAATAEPTDAKIDSLQGAWGHLQLDPRSPQFLVNKRNGQTWRACVPRYMTTKMPGFEAELEAAVNLWAHYVDRRIAVQIEVKDLPRATATSDLRELAKAYHDTCGSGFDAVLGLAPLTGATLGITSGDGMVDRQGNWLSFRRFVFLRDFDVAPDDLGGKPSQWVAYGTQTSTTTTADALLTKMKERSFLRYAERGQRLALPVLVHEIGHVWGLCDQYESAANCDPQNSTTHLVSESIMGSASIRERGYLTDDDIDGIRALVARPGFDAGWPAPARTAPTPIVSQPVELFRFEGLERAPGMVVLAMGLVSNVAVKLDFAYRNVGTEAWRSFRPMAYEGPTDAPILAMSLPVDASATRVEVRGILSVRGAGGAWSPLKTLTTSE